MDHDSLNPASIVSCVYFFHSREANNGHLFVNSVFACLLYFLGINSQKGEKRVRGSECFCGLCYIMCCCFPKGTMLISFFQDYFN